jgi:hypothetical protein
MKSVKTAAVCNWRIYQRSHNRPVEKNTQPPYFNRLLNAYGRCAHAIKEPWHYNLMSSAERFIMNTTSKILTGLLVGTLVGALAGVLLAPSTGKTTRKKINKKAKKLVKQLEGYLGMTKTRSRTTTHSRIQKNGRAAVAAR